LHTVYPQGMRLGGYKKKIWVAVEKLLAIGERLE